MNFEEIGLLMYVNRTNSIILESRGRDIEGVAVVQQPFTGLSPDRKGVGKGFAGFGSQFDGSTHDIGWTDRIIAIVV